MLVDHLTVPDQPFKQRAAIPIVEALRSTPPLEIQTTGPHPNATTPAPLAACAGVQTRRPRTLPTATVMCPCLMQLVFGPLPCVSSRFDSRMPLHRSEEHTSELQSLMRSSYAVLCLTKKMTDQKSTQKQSSQKYT